MSALALGIFLVVLALLAWALNRRNRSRADLAENRLRESIGFGTEVMTTSGLYGTVVGMNDDDTVQLSIAPGVEVKWAFAALRDVASLPQRYRQGMEPEPEPLDDWSQLETRGQPEQATPPDDLPPDERP